MTTAKIDPHTSEPIVLACGKGACCPSMTINDKFGTVTFRDQDDGKNEIVVLTKAQARMALEILNERL